MPGKGRPFVKGDPRAGRKPALPPDVRAQLAAAAPKAIETLIRLMDSPDEKTAVAAANSVLDRHLGRPAQTVITTTEPAVPEPVQLSSADRIELEAVAMQAAN